ncbi:MAG: hypothetical protein ACRD9L_03670, partial [Bryobacteraceae bacterium]
MLVAGGAFVASLTRLLCYYRRILEGTPSPRAPRLYSAVAVAVCGETGIVAAYIGWAIAAAALLGAAIAMLTWRLAAINEP